MQDLAKSSYLTALADGEEQAELTAEIASTFKFKPKLLAFESVESQETRIPFFYSGKSLGYRLEVFGCFRFIWRGFAFGISKTGEPIQQEK